MYWGTIVKRCLNSTGLWTVLNILRRLTVNPPCLLVSLEPLRSEDCEMSLGRSCLTLGGQAVAFYPVSVGLNDLLMIGNSELSIADQLVK
jgi:hypothetical protein